MLNETYLFLGYTLKIYFSVTCISIKLLLGRDKRFSFSVFFAHHENFDHFSIGGHSFSFK